MPDPRPLSSIRFGQYDHPPATESSTPRTRRSRLHNALRATADMAANDLAEMGASTAVRSNRPPYLGPLQRRRQRSPVTIDPRDTGSNEDSRRRRHKRRKLDSELSAAPKQPIKYGHYGQVEPGKLKLEIISCDGGEHRDPRHPSTYLGSQNLLQHDKSVYCSERSSSGIVLRHADDTPFCLEKLHIVGPEHGFTAPVREGLVYVAMTLSDLSKYMDPPQYARMHGVHTPPYRARRSFVASPERITLSDALRDPEVGSALDARQREQHEYANRADALHDTSEAPHYGHDFGFGRYDAEAHCDITSSGEVTDVLVSANDSLPVTLLSDEEPGPEESSSQEVLDFRLQRLRNMRRRFEDSWDREERMNSSNDPYTDDRDRDGEWRLRHLDAMMARSRMADSPQRDETPDERERNERYFGPETSSYYHPTERSDGLDYYNDGLNDPNVTRARFHIRRGKYKVAIKFDPPVSGKFILLKLWANRSNVDVQSVVAKGFGGARYFPAIEFR